MACEHPPIPKSPGKNWIERIPGGRIPEEIECVARALYHGPTAHGDKQKAYRMAVGIAEDWAKGKRTKDPKTIAKYQAAVAKWETLRAASIAHTAAKNLTDSDCGCGGAEPIDLATAVTTARSSQPARMNGLYDIAATVARLKKHPKLKNLPDSELQRIATARILRRQLRNRLGITDLKKLAPRQLKELEKAGLVGGGKAKVGTVVSYTLQRGPRKGQTISVRRTPSGWHEVNPPKAVSG